jgi:hypothetical protein
MKLIKTARILTLSAMLPFAAFAATSAIAEDEGSAAKGAATGAAVGAATGMRAGKGAAAGAIIGRTKSDEPSAGKGAATGAAFGAATGRGAAKGAATGAIIGGAKKNNDGSKEHLTEVLWVRSGRSLASARGPFSANNGHQSLCLVLVRCY